MQTDPTVFVVDDDAFMRKLLHRIFSNAGIAVRTFESAQLLLDGADLNSSCVLLLDVNMPNMSGPELHALLRERRVDVPVVFLTAVADVPMAVLALRNGAADFIEKPFESGALIERVRQSFALCAGPAASRPEVEIAARFSSLTPRERAVLRLMITGASSKRIARTLGGSFRTIEKHRGRIMVKMGAGSLVQLLRMRTESWAASTAPPLQPA